MCRAMDGRILSGTCELVILHCGVLHVRHEVIVVSYMPRTPPRVSKRPGNLQFCSHGLDISNVPSIDCVAAGDCLLKTVAPPFCFSVERR